MRHALSLAAVAALTVLAACQESITPTPDDPQVRAQPEGFPVRGEMRTGWILENGFHPVQVSFEVINGRAIWEGDIDLGPAEEIPETREKALRPSFGVVRDGSTALWPSGVVPYTIDANVPQPSRVTNAISHIESKTNRPDFVPRTNQRDYVRVVRSNGCASSVGRVGGVQYVYLADGCSTGNTIHELAHALGLYHEHTRCDRDTYVVILTQNIQSGTSGNFTKQCSGATDYHGYDEGSIMHYGPYAFSSNGLPTIQSLRGLDRLMGQRSGLSNTDVATINTIYP